MKRAFAKTLSSVAFLAVTLSSVHATTDSPFPSAARELGEPLPATLQFLEQRASRAPVDTRRWESPFPRSAVGVASRVWTPEELRYWQKRDAEIANELKNTPTSGRFDYIPRSNIRQ